MKLYYIEEVYMIINMSDHRDHLVQNLPEYVPQTTIPKKP